MLAHFYIPMISNDMKIPVQRNYLGGIIVYKVCTHLKKRRHGYICVCPTVASLNLQEPCNKPKKKKKNNCIKQWNVPEGRCV